MSKVGVIGAGSWGTALAIAAARAGSEVILWSRSRNIVDDINNNNLNSEYLGNIPLHKNIKATNDIVEALRCDVALLAIPAQSLRGFCEEVTKVFVEKHLDSERVTNSAGSVQEILNLNKNIDGMLDVIYSQLSEVPEISKNKSTKTSKKKNKGIRIGGVNIVICCKGIEQNSLKLMSEVVAEYFPDNNVAIFSGPNFADEIANGLPACATLACKDKAAAEKIIQSLGSERLRLYYSDDVVGAQIGGAVKNVIAIACGIAIGKGLGENARAALVTRGIAEIGRLCVQIGGKPETLMGLSGVGDIMLSCASEKSRNMHLGVELGRGNKLKEILEHSRTVEGVATAKSVTMLATKIGIDMPIATAVKMILHDNASIESTIKALLDRPVTAEGI